MYTTLLAGLVGLTTAAPLPPRAVFGWKFVPGRPIRQEMVTDTQQKMVVAGQTIEQTQKQTFIFVSTPEKKLPDGTWLIRQKIEAIRMSIDIGGNKVEYDSAKKGEANPLAEFFDALLTVEFRMRLDAERGIVGVEGREEFVEKLAKASPQMKPLLQTILTDEALKEMGAQTFAAPPPTLKVGEAWERASRLELGPIGTYAGKYRYTPIKSQGSMQTYRLDTVDFRYHPPQGDFEGLPFKIKAADLRAETTHGEIQYNLARGRVERITHRLSLNGTMNIEIGGQVTEVKLEQMQTTTCRSLDPELSR
jgi:hypothetical protein